MTLPIKILMTRCLIESTSIADKAKDGIITSEQSHDLTVNLIENTTAAVAKHTRENFVTDN